MKARIRIPILFLLLIVMCSCSIFGQTFKGKLIDASTGDPLIGANIHNKSYSTTSDLYGFFSISARVGDTITITYISFDEMSVLATDETINSETNLIKLIKSENILETATVTTSRFDRKLSDANVSIDVMKPALIKNTNTTRIDDVLNKVPGVQMIDGQANIRGGSGFSYGAGSRVMLLIDNLPALQSDAGFPNWTDIPVENISQVEIVKGAASALYGSSALNGIINIRRKRPTLTPETELSVGYTHFFDPNDPRKKWWENEDAPYGYHASVVHRRKIDNLELTGSFFHRKLRSYNQSTFEERNRIALNLRKNVDDKMAFGVNTMINNTDNGSFFIWANPVTGAHTPYPGSEATSNSTRFMIDPFFHYFEDDGDAHRILTRYLDISNDNNMDQSNSSKMLYTEYQYQSKLESIDANLTAGLLYSNTNSEAQLFGDTTFNNKNLAAYAQFDKSWEKLSFSFGARYEYNKQKSPENFMGQTIEDGVSSDGKPIFRVGANYKIHEYSSIRANWGQGYRFPTITERFVTTQFAGFRIFPNVSLQPEFGWSSEIGIKQGVSVLGFKGFVDIVGFWSEYEDMMEFTLVNLGTIGFQSQNIGDTRITGMEMSVFGRAELGSIPLNIYGGYTYMNPKYQNFTEEIEAASSSDENILKYRSKNNYKLDVEGFYKNFSLGASVQGASHMVAIDAALRLLPGAGIEDYRTVYNKGYKVLDTRLGYKLDDLKFSVIMNNIMNKEYTVRPALLEAPRNLSFRMDYTI